MALTKISTDGVKDDAITKAKIPADQIEASELANNAVDTNAIADQAVTLDKLPHGDANNDGKFLRANNGADPTFEDIPAGVTINQNGSDKVITGSSTANNLNGQSNFTYDGTKLFLKGGSSPSGHVNFLELKHNNTASSTSNNTGDGPAMLLNGHYGGADWALAKIAAVNAGGQYGSGYAGGLQFWVHPANGNINASVIKGAEIIGDGTGADLYITNGDIKFASGHGIDFSASSNESGSTTELLNDYERGSFNAYWRFDPTNATGVTYNYNAGMYVKVGRMVYFTIHMWTSNKGSLSGGAGWCQIQGLPFAVDGEGGFASIAYYDNFGSYNPAVARVTPSEQIYIAQHNNGGYSQDLQHSHMNNSSRMHIGGCYGTTA